MECYAYVFRSDPSARPRSSSSSCTRHRLPHCAGRKRSHSRNNRYVDKIQAYKRELERLKQERVWMRTLIGCLVLLSVVLLLSLALVAAFETSSGATSSTAPSSSTQAIAEAFEDFKNVRPSCLRGKKGKGRAPFQRERDSLSHALVLKLDQLKLNITAL